MTEGMDSPPVFTRAGSSREKRLGCWYEGRIDSRIRGPLRNRHSSPRPGIREWGCRIKPHVYSAQFGLSLAVMQGYPFAGITGGGGFPPTDIARAGLPRGDGFPQQRGQRVGAGEGKGRFSNRPYVLLTTWASKVSWKTTFIVITRADCIDWA